MASKEKADEVGLFETQNRNQPNADVRPQLRLRMYDQRFPSSRSELSGPIQENQQWYGQASVGLPSIQETDGDPTIHNGVLPVPVSSNIRCSDTSCPGIGRCRPFGSVPVDQDDHPIMSNGGVSYPPDVGSMSHHDSPFHMEVEDAWAVSEGIGRCRPFRSVPVYQDDHPIMSNGGVSYPPDVGSMSHHDSPFHMEVEGAGAVSQDQSINSTMMLKVNDTREQTLLLLPEVIKPRLSDSDVSMESDDSTIELPQQHIQEILNAYADSKLNREKSFEEKNAPDIFYSNSHLGPSIMAENGLCYTGFKDCVVCFGCKTMICKWKSSDDPLIEHIRLGPKGICPYLKSTMDPSILSELLNNISYGEMSYDSGETAGKQQISNDQRPLQQQQVLESSVEMSAASTTLFRSFTDTNESSTYLTTTPGPSSVALSSSCAQNSQTMYKLELQSSEYRPGLAKYKQAEERRDEEFLCQDCLKNKVNHTQQDCGHGICGECIRCMRGTPMYSRKCKTCKSSVVGYTAWAPPHL